jgi:hypothetical protein
MDTNALSVFRHLENTRYTHCGVFRGLHSGVSARGGRAFMDVNGEFLRQDGAFSALTTQRAFGRGLPPFTGMGYGLC